MFVFGMTGGVGMGYLRMHFQILQSQSKEASVVDYMSWNAGNCHWDITFIGAIQDWEKDILTDFFNFNYSKFATKIRRDSEYHICWVAT